MKVFFKVTTYILIKRKLVKKLPKVYPSHGSPNNQKETKSHGLQCNSAINHKEKQYHMVHIWLHNSSQGNNITWCTCDYTIHHKETISHGAHVIAQFITRKQYHMVHMWLHNSSQGNNIICCTCDCTINHKETISHGAHDFHIN
jgi:hypothetical protein